MQRSSKHVNFSAFALRPFFQEMAELPGKDTFCCIAGATLKAMDAAPHKRKFEAAVYRSLAEILKGPEQSTVTMLATAAVKVMKHWDSSGKADLSDMNNVYSQIIHAFVDEITRATDDPPARALAETGTRSSMAP